MNTNMRTLLAALAAGVLTAAVSAEDWTIPPAFSNVVMAISPRGMAPVVPRIPLAADGDPVVVTNPAPQIQIRREGDHLAVDYEPCCIELSFDGGRIFLRLACFYQSGRMTINRNRPSVLVRAMPLGSPWPDPSTNTVKQVTGP